MVVAVMLGVFLVTVVGCTQQVAGPPIDPVLLTTPNPVAAPAPPPRTDLAPPAPTGHLTAWEPYRCLSSGECIEGHWVSIPLTPPRREVLEPARPVPRAPRVPTVLKRSGKPEPPAHAPDPSRTDSSRMTPSMAPSSLPTMQLPPGMGLEQIQEQIRTMQQGGR